MRNINKFGMICMLLNLIAIWSMISTMYIDVSLSYLMIAGIFACLSMICNGIFLTSYIIEKNYERLN
jgi:hypothetical protein